MLSGRTSVYIDTVKSDGDSAPANGEISDASATDEPVLATETVVLDRLITGWSRSSSLTPDASELIKEIDKTNQLDRDKFGKFILCYEPGKSFGEIALMSPDNVRNASIIADEETDLMSVSRELFNRSLKAKQIQEYEERKRFIKESPLFGQWHPKFQRLLEMSLRKECYSFESTIVKQGTPVIGLHFIIKGQAKVTIEPANHKKQFQNLMNIQDSQSEADKIRRVKPNIVREMEHKKRGLTQENIRIRRKEGYVAAEQNYQRNALDICSIGENEIFGDIETILRLDTYIQTIICTANTEVYILDLKNYDRLVKRYHTTVEQLNEKAKEKLRCRSQTVYGRKIPLLNNLLRMLNEIAKPTEIPPAAKTKNYKTKDNEIQDLVKLYLNDKITALVDSCVPGSLYYKTMSFKKEQARINAMEKMATGRSKGWRFFYQTTKERRPRSRRELENLATKSPYSFGQNLSTSKSNFLHERRPSIACSLPADDHLIDEMLEELNAVAKQQEDDYQLKKLGIQNPDGLITRESLINVLNEMGNHQQDQMDSRMKIVSGLLDKDKLSQHEEMWKLTRPRSAPVGLRGRLGSVSSYASDEVDIDDYFDRETSDIALRQLEGKVKRFLAKSVTPIGNKSDNVPVQEMRRFELKSAMDVPIAGGTVFVRQKQCRYPRGSVLSEDSHKHVRHFMLPKNAISAIAEERERARSAKSTRSLPAGQRSRKVSATIRPKSAFAT
ncbi:uncharacterized protein LOC141915039 [Tubulanus polymorphus]|uniref:uncharacterized protein LOC141915039 n=1 Tax=Tubulanus polymorphus TaxID=672921 RepID=UPI003DA5F580